MSGYFENFTKMMYANTLATNIFSRVKIEDSISKDTSLYYPYEVQEGERPDNIAANYYDDPKLDWLVYFSNKMIDPYFEWPLPVNDFNQYIINKYGSTEEAELRILFYRVNWYNDDTVLSPASYQALGPRQKKYWRPVLGINDQVISYERKDMDVVADTNKVVSLTVTVSDVFQEDERIIQLNSSGVKIAEGIVAQANTSSIVVNRIQGQFVANPWLTGQRSRATADCSAVTTISTSIPADEFAYWTPVTAYMYEEELNASRRTIYLIDKAYVNTIEKQIRELLA